jgi:hypothetical protein
VSALDRYVDAVGGNAAELVRARGRGGFRQPLAGSLGFWIPMRWELHLVPASDFVFLASVRLLGRSVLRGGDEYRDGRGRFRMGRRTLDGPAVDRAEYAALVGWTAVLAPGALVARSGVIAERGDGPDAVRVVFPFGTETWECVLRFDPAGGLLSRLETHRDDLRGGSRRWSAEVERWTTRDGRPSPERVLTRWEETPAVRVEFEAVEREGEG